jgi:4,5-dihydroxyphthalate decarboxylase
MLDDSSKNTIEVVGNNYPFFRHVEGIRDNLKLNYNPVSGVEAFKAVLENKPFEVNEFSLANYSMMKDRGVDWMTAIPIFLNRDFRHGSLYVRKDSELIHPSNLVGKTIGAREFSQTAGVWWRGTMIDQYDLHWSDLKWVTGSNQRFTPPEEAFVEIIEGDLEQLVVEGVIDAFLSPITKDEQNPEEERKLRPIFPDTESEERNYFQQTGIYPLNHTVVIHKDVLTKHPSLPLTLFNAFSYSKEKFYKKEGMQNPWGDSTSNDCMTFGLTDKNVEIVNTLLSYLLEQKLISKTPNIEELFVTGSLEFTEN